MNTQNKQPKNIQRLDVFRCMKHTNVMPKLKQPYFKPLSAPGKSPTVFGDTVCRELLIRLELGSSRKDACALCQVLLNTFESWINMGKLQAECRGRLPDDIDGGPLTLQEQFFMDVLTAEAKFRTAINTKIISAFVGVNGKPGDNKMAPVVISLLERIDPANYGRTAVQQNITGAIAVKVSFGAKSDSEWSGRIALPDNGDEADELEPGVIVTEFLPDRKGDALNG